MKTIRTLVHTVAALAIAGSAAGCLAAAGAAAGAAGAIAYNERGATTEVEQSVAEVATAAEAALADLGITVTGRSTRESGAEMKLEGTDGDKDISVDVDAEDDGMTHIQVIAKEDVVQYDRDRAEAILRAILDRL